MQGFFPSKFKMQHWNVDITKTNKYIKTEQVGTHTQEQARMHTRTAH